MFRHRSSVSVHTRVHRPPRSHIPPYDPASGRRRRRRVPGTESDESDSGDEQNTDTATTSPTRKRKRERVKMGEPDGDPPGPPGGDERYTKKRGRIPVHNPELQANYFLVKSDVDVFSIHDLAKCKNQTAAWQGIQSPTAIKTMKKMKKKSLAFFFATNMEDPAIVGVVQVSREAYPLKTTTQGDSKKKQYSMDVTLVEIFKTPITLHELKAHSALRFMPLYRKRVPIQTVPDMLWRYIMKAKSHQEDV